MKTEGVVIRTGLRSKLTQVWVSCRSELHMSKTYSNKSQLVEAVCVYVCVVYMRAVNEPLSARGGLPVSFLY